MPLRLVYGPADPVNGERTAAVFRREVADADVVRLADGVGHYPQIEDPEAVWTAFEEHLEQARERRESP